MCTVSYLPLNSEDYLLIQNRDVGKSRVSAEPPIERSVQGMKLISPLDPQGGGTWNAISATHHAFILNGADFSYYPDFNAARSRGELCIKLLTEGENYLREIQLKEFDHFTLGLINTAEPDAPISEWRWNGRELKKSTYDARRPQFWISHGLYTAGDYTRKKNLFNAWCDNNLSLASANAHSDIAQKLWEWQSRPIVDGKEGFVIDRPSGVMTVSIFRTLKHKDKYDFTYKDLKTREITLLRDINL